LQQRHGEFSGDAMRQREKNNLRLFREQFGIGFAEAERLGLRMMAELREDRASVCPAYWREVSAVNSACGCVNKRRTNSSPE
jgi:hypothetical protein